MFANKILRLEVVSLGFIQPEDADNFNFLRTGPIYWPPASLVLGTVKFLYSWILGTNKRRLVVWESAMPVYTIAFASLGNPRTQFYVRGENANILALYKRFSAAKAHKTDQGLNLTYASTQFEADRAENLACLERERAK